MGNTMNNNKFTAKEIKSLFFYEYPEACLAPPPPPPWGGPPKKKYMAIIRGKQVYICEHIKPQVKNI